MFHHPTRGGGPLPYLPRSITLTAFALTIKAGLKALPHCYLETAEMRGAPQFGAEFRELLATLLPCIRRLGIGVGVGIGLGIGLGSGLLATLLPYIRRRRHAVANPNPDPTPTPSPTPNPRRRHAVARELVRPPLALCHGDCHLENVFFGEHFEGGCMFIDFGLTG